MATPDGPVMESVTMTGEETIVISPDRMSRMARRQTARRRHRHRRRRAIPMLPLMVVSAFVWLAGMMALIWLYPVTSTCPWPAREACTGVCVMAAVAAPLPSLRYRRDA